MKRETKHGRDKASSHGKKESKSYQQLKKKANPAAMKNPPQAGGSVLETEPEDIQEFKRRKKIATKAAHEEEEEDVNILELISFGDADGEDEEELRVKSYR